MNLHRTTSGPNAEWAPWIKDGEEVFYCTSSYGDPANEQPRSAGFSFHGRKVSGEWKGKKLWYTADRDKAAKLADFAPLGLDWVEDLKARKERLFKSLVGSRQSVGYADFPHPEGYDYFPFQKAGIEYMSVRKSTLLADDMGLGKTIQAIGLINVDESIKKVLVICPATLKLNWQRELNRWLVRRENVGIADTKYVPTPDSGYPIVVTNYETVSKTNSILAEIDWDLLIIDEVHYLKNPKTLRYLSIMGGKHNDREFRKIDAKFRLFMTGTPIVNRPAELWPIISAVDPEHWNARTFWFYHKRYCGAARGRFGMDMRGRGSEKDLQELQIKLRETIMIRRLKSEVLTELPPKIRQVIELEYDDNDMAVRAAIKHEKEYETVKMNNEKTMELAAAAELAKASENDDEYRSAIEALGQKNKFLFEEMSKVRHDTAMAKVPYAIKYIEEQLEVAQKVIIFYHHKDVGHALANKWQLESMTISGEVSQNDRQLAIDRFQSDPVCRIALVSIMAGGVGITLTAASHVYFVELDWVPGNVTQAEDRAHRIGQKDCVNVYHLVLRESIDVNMARTIIEKQRVIEAALDKVMEFDPAVPIRETAATHNTSRKQIAEDAAKMTASLIEQVHAGLKIIAGADRDYAKARNMVGFNSLDTKIGHALSLCARLTPRQAALGRKLLRKYKRQLGDFYKPIFPDEETPVKKKEEYNYSNI